MAERVLVTGASGFIGTSLTEKLLATSGLEVIGLDRVRPKESWQRTVVQSCDLLDYPELLSLLIWWRPTAIVHCAAQARVEPSMADPLGTYELNVEATLNVMRASKAVGIKHIVCLSSEAVYGRGRTYPSPENNDFAPINPYAASKVAVDVLCQQFDRLVPMCVIRSGMGWGPRQNPAEQVTGRFITKALRKETLKFPSDQNIVHPTRDLNHVEDFCRGVGTVLEKRARGVYNLSGGREYTVLAIANAVINAVGSGSIGFDSEFQYREGELGFRTWLDVSKAQRDLGHSPQNHLVGEDGEPSDALRNAIKWYAANTNYWSN